jgi:hypothetical protein
MDGRVLRYFFDPRMPGVVSFSTQHGLLHEFANVEVEHGDILEYAADGTPVRAWTRGRIPASISAEAERQRVAEQAERNRALDEWRQQARSRARGAIKLPYQLK